MRKCTFGLVHHGKTPTRVDGLIRFLTEVSSGGQRGIWSDREDTQLDQRLHWSHKFDGIFYHILTYLSSLVHVHAELYEAFHDNKFVLFCCNHQRCQSIVLKYKYDPQREKTHVWACAPMCAQRVRPTKTQISLRIRTV